MMTLIIGTPDSGKSAYAEQVAQFYSDGQRMAYVATMIPYGEEGLQRVEKHRKLRADKSFVTFEQPVAVGAIAGDLAKEGLDTVLLECVSNLVGNEMYHENNKALSDDALQLLIVDEIKELSKAVSHLIVVTNRFAMEEHFDEETRRYVRMQMAVNELLKQEADQYAVKRGEEWVMYENH